MRDSMPYAADSPSGGLPIDPPLPATISVRARAPVSPGPVPAPRLRRAFPTPPLPECPQAPDGLKFSPSGA
ncbi:hypothetical protein FHS36_001927 [Streptomyces eurocidicus]|uniref:Uncharacterized protein n=1 Tax=Streptomyces eurocidicus TaxID=66423 RepID=A0A7W8B7Z3_STREU|nr:hypothetical protein [Streptomyces eurocidicus]